MLHLQSGFWVSEAHNDTPQECKKKTQQGGGRGGGAVQWPVTFSSSVWKLGKQSSQMEIIFPWDPSGGL